jgi:hypothetical protein
VDPFRNLNRWNITEEQAFHLAIKNLDAITPPKLNCIHIKSMAELQKSNKTKRRSLTQITHLIFGSPRSGGTLIVEFSDSRALPRLLLPRVIERLAEVLRCDLPSLVIVPFEDSTFVVANGEDRFSMLLMAVHQTLPFCQGDNPHVKHKVSWNPFRVRSFTAYRWKAKQQKLTQMNFFLFTSGLDLHEHFQVMYLYFFTTILILQTCVSCFSLITLYFVPLFAPSCRAC